MTESAEEMIAEHRRTSLLMELKASDNELAEKIIHLRELRRRWEHTYDLEEAEERLFAQVESIDELAKMRLQITHNLSERLELYNNLDDEAKNAIFWDILLSILTIRRYIQEVTDIRIKLLETECEILSGD